MKNCWDKILNSSPEIVAYLKEQAKGIDYNPTTKEGRDAYIKAAKELQEQSLNTINDIYSDLGIEGYKKTEKVTSETDLLITAKDLVNTDVVKGFSAAPLKDAANNNPEEFKNYLSEIAQQAHDENSVKETINTYGQELVDVANKLFPKTEETKSVEPSVDVSTVEGKNELDKEVDNAVANGVDEKWFKELKEKYPSKQLVIDNENGTFTAIHPNGEFKYNDAEKAIRESFKIGFDGAMLVKKSELPSKEVKKATKPKTESKVVLDEGNGKQVNDIYNQWNKIKNEKDLAAWKAKVKDTKFGTYGTIGIFDVLEKFAPNINSVTKENFYRDIEEALNVPLSERKFAANKIEPSPKEIKSDKGIVVDKEENKTEKEGRFEEAAKKLAEKVRSGKINKLGGFKSSTGFDVVWDGAMEAVATSLELSGKAADAVQKAIEAGFEYIKKTDWYKGLTDKKDFEEKYRNHLEKEFGEAPPKPPVDDNKTEDEEGRGIRHASTAKLREKYNLGTYERNNATDAELEALADEAIKEGYNPETLIKQMEEGIPPATGVENFILKKYLATLEAKFDKNPSDENLAPIERLVNATDKIGSLQSEVFRTRNGLVPVDDSLAGYFITEKELNLDAPLTEGQKDKVKKEYADIAEAQKEYEDKLAKLQAENDKMRADLELKKQVLKKAKTKKSHEDFVNERRSIINDIQAKLKKARSETNVTPIPYAKELITIAPDVAKLVRNLVEEGVTKLSDIVADIHDSLKDSIKGLTQEDVVNIIAGDYNEKKQTRNEIAKQVFDLKTEAALIGKFEKLNEGIEPKNEKDKIKRNQELEGLRKQIKEHDLTKLADYKSKAKARVAKLENDLATGNYETPQKPLPIKLDKEALALKDKVIKLKNERHFRILMQQHENKTTREKAIRGVVEVLNIPRTLMTIVDYSAVLRQGIIQSISHPSLVFNFSKEDGKVKIGGAAIDMFKAGASQKIYDRWFYDLKETPRYELMEQSKLGITDSTSPLLAAREEGFMSNLAEKIPLIGKTLNINVGGKAIKIPGTNLVKGSERSYSMFLNKMRVDLFNRFADAMEERGVTFENSPDAYKQMAEYINNSTGRGSLGNTLNKIAPLANALLFSPRLIASRLNMLTYLAQPRFYKTVPKEVRMDYFKGMAKFIGVGATVLALASLAGGDDDDKEKITVETDPRSSDFGKIKQKNTRWDIWGGFQPYIRVASQAISGNRKTAGGELYDLSGDGPFGQTRGGVLLDFARSKLAPVPAMAVDLFSGRNQIGEKIVFETSTKEDKEITIGSYIKDHLLPLTYTGLEEAMKDQGTKALFTVGVPSIFGVGTQTYESSAGKKNTFKIYNPNGVGEKAVREATPEEHKKYIEDRDKLAEKKIEAVKKRKTVWVNSYGELTIDPDATVGTRPLKEEDMKDLEERLKKQAAGEVKKTIKF